ncbi:hypothetical protein DFH08DRAFT_825436 [Mycena albidolilacea]|uniref:Uncharacterized protein n=1 Tax=Mycena albidolilacea TaxID=1033008 RepID=A0AAD6Z252_9AGAR|nr:hypothetical protein DFH08DRAFT_825436 [Mycena albidolilacea]
MSGIWSLGPQIPIFFHRAECVGRSSKAHSCIQPHIELCRRVFPPRSSAILSTLQASAMTGNLESPRQNLPVHLVAFIGTNPCSAMNLFCVRLETRCPCKIGYMLRSPRESDKQEKAFVELTYGKNNIFSGLRSGQENQKASRLQGGSDCQMIADRKPRKADRLPTPTKEQRDLCNAWPTPLQVSQWQLHDVADVATRFREYGIELKHGPQGHNAQNDGMPSTTNPGDFEERFMSQAGYFYLE